MALLSLRLMERQRRYYLDIREYEKTQESLSLLRILAQSKKSHEAGKVKSLKKAVSDIKAKAKGIS